MEQRQPVGLDDRPDEPGEHRERPEQRDGAGAPAAYRQAPSYVGLQLCFHLLPSRDVENKTTPRAP